MVYTPYNRIHVVCADLVTKSVYLMYFLLAQLITYVQLLQVRDIVSTILRGLSCGPWQAEAGPFQTLLYVPTPSVFQSTLTLLHFNPKGYTLHTTAPSVWCTDCILCKNTCTLPAYSDICQVSPQLRFLQCRQHTLQPINALSPSPVISPERGRNVAVHTCLDSAARKIPQQIEDAYDLPSSSQECVLVTRLVHMKHTQSSNRQKAEGRYGYNAFAVCRCTTIQGTLPTIRTYTTVRVVEKMETPFFACLGATRLENHCSRFQSVGLGCCCLFVEDEDPSDVFSLVQLQGLTVFAYITDGIIDE